MKAEIVRGDPGVRRRAVALLLGAAVLGGATIQWGLPWLETARHSRPGVQRAICVTFAAVIVTLAVAVIALGRRIAGLGRRTAELGQFPPPGLEVTARCAQHHRRPGCACRPGLRGHRLDARRASDRAARLGKLRAGTCVAAIEMPRTDTVGRVSCQETGGMPLARRCAALPPGTRWTRPRTPQSFQTRNDWWRGRCDHRHSDSPQASPWGGYGTEPVLGGAPRAAQVPTCRRPSRFALFLLVSAHLAAPCTAQSGKSTRVWIAGGLGTAAVGQLVVQRRPHQITARGLLAFDPLDPSDCVFGELGLLYGRTVTVPLGHASISAGVGAAKPPGCLTGGDNLEAGWILGVPLVAEAAVRLLPVLGVGVQGFVNLNSGATFGGVALFVQLGWLPR